MAANMVHYRHLMRRRQPEQTHQGADEANSSDLKDYDTLLKLLGRPRVLVLIEANNRAEACEHLAAILYEDGPGEVTKLAGRLFFSQAHASGKYWLLKPASALKKSRTEDGSKSSHSRRVQKPKES